MSWFKASVLTLFAAPVWAAEGYIVSIGVEADSEDAMAGSISGELGLAENTWLSGAVAKNSVDLPLGISVDTIYTDIGIDHWFDPVGLRATVAYWGDSDVLDSLDYRASLYWRDDRVSIAGDFEYRVFSFDIFRGDLRPGQDVRFHANGAGLTARFELNDA
ncbi:MAG: hypothetical protein HQ492_07195, partial [Woeseiaceae bacterium]|nr:hypothetical protein [Woeseiaceae bacterium]